MSKVKIFFVLLVLFLLLIIFVPGILQLQKLKGVNQDLTDGIKKLKIENTQLSQEVKRLKHDPVYVEKIAREKMKMSKKGEVIYKVSGDEEASK